MNLLRNILTSLKEGIKFFKGCNMDGDDILYFTGIGFFLLLIITLIINKF